MTKYNYCKHEIQDTVIISKLFSRIFNNYCRTSSLDLYYLHDNWVKSDSLKDLNIGKCVK